jgi:hypothetical protein
MPDESRQAFLFSDQSEKFWWEVQVSNLDTGYARVPFTTEGVILKSIKYPQIPIIIPSVIPESSN